MHIQIKSYDSKVDLKRLKQLATQLQKLSIFKKLTYESSDKGVYTKGAFAYLSTGDKEDIYVGKPRKGETMYRSDDTHDVAYVELHLLNSLLSLDNIIMSGKFRGKGYAKKIIKMLEDWCKKNDVQLTYLEENKSFWNHMKGK